MDRELKSTLWDDPAFSNALIYGAGQTLNLLQGAGGIGLMFTGPVGFALGGYLLASATSRYVGNLSPGSDVIQDLHDWALTPEVGKYSRPITDVIVGLGGGLYALRPFPRSGACRNLLPKTTEYAPELPPGWDYDWDLTWGTRAKAEGPHWFDPNGGEWRWHYADKYHNPHWDYNPWDWYGDQWRNVPGWEQRPPLK